MSHFLRKFSFVLYAVFCMLTFLSQEAVFAQTPVCNPNSGVASADVDSFCSSGSPKLLVEGASYGSGFTHQWFSSTTGAAASFTVVSSAIDTLYNSSSISSNRYYYCVTTCASSSLKDTSNTVLVKVSASVTNPAVAIKSTDTSICAGTPVTFSIVSQSGAGSVVVIPGTPALTSNNTGNPTATTGCVQAGGYWASGWGTNSYWQYRMSTVGYEGITFSAPTSSSTTGPHSGTVYYSTNGSTFTQVGSPYSWSGTGCTSTGVFTLPADAANQPNLYIRLVMTGASSTAGTNRVGAGTFSGKKIPERISTTYQWKKNGANVGTNTDSYTDNGLQHEDVVTLEATANVCASPAKVTSNSIKIALDSAVTPVVTTTVSPGDTICAGTQVTFTATSINGGTSPLYNWRRNGSVVSTNATYITSALNNNDVITCTVLSNLTSCLISTRDTSDTIRIVVNPTVTPSITTSVSPGDTICSGSEVVFTATAINGGNNPVYKWLLNGTAVGANSNTYTNSLLNTDDVITCELVSDALCLTKTNDTSDTVKMFVNPLFSPVVSTVISPNDTICEGTPVTFTATATDAGVAPVYQWMLNGVNVAANTVTYITDSLKNDDIVTCEVTSSSNICVTKQKDTSDAIKVVVNTWVTPSVATTVAPGDTVCAGTQVTFTALATNGGVAPAYQWLLNGTAVGANSNTYSINSLNDEDVITCEVLSNAACLTVTKDTSDSVTMIVNPILTPAVVTTVSPNDTICAGTNVIFTATGVNGGSGATYQWTLNGTAVGTNSATYSNANLNTNDVVVCEFVSTESCISKVSDTSDETKMTVNPILNPNIDIFVSPNDTVCANTPVTFTSNIAFGGTTPVYQWKKNNNIIAGATGNTWFTSTLSHGDIITCELTSNAVCAMPVRDTSNFIFMNIPSTGFPKVSVTVNPGTRVEAGTSMTFSAIVTDGGVAPTYEWRRNNITIPGATGATYTTNTLNDKDVINVFVASSDSCANPDTVLSRDITVDITVSVFDTHEAGTEIGLYPNPNNGQFALKGSFASLGNKQAQVEVLNSVGSVIYRNSVQIENNQLNTKIDLGGAITNGLHLVRIAVDGKTYVLKFVASK